jgi:hypothetical protein
VSIGKGDLDLIEFNVYKKQHTTWKTNITSALETFGNTSTYITEFSISSVSLADYSSSEEIQAREIGMMLEDIQTLGIKRAYFFTYRDANFGALNTDGVYRLLWNNLTTNNGRRWFI